MDNARFNQLLSLGKEGDSAAIADLWHEFNFDFYSDDPSSICADQRSSADKKSSDGESV